MTHDDQTDGTHREGRRSFLKKVGIGTAVAWTAPTIATSRAFAQGTCGITGPLDVTGVFAWYDGADPTTINSFNPPPIADVAVQQWDDKSGNARHLEQLTVANQPTWRFNTGINGLGSVEFFGAEFLDWINTDAAFAALTNTTIFLVVRYDTAPTDGPVLWGWDSANPGVTTAWVVGGPDPTGTLVNETFTLASGGGATGTDATNYTWAAGTDDQIMITQDSTVPANTLITTVATGNFNIGNPGQDLSPSVANADTLRVGADDLVVQTFFDGMVAEVVLYDRVLTALEQSQVSCYLTLKWFT